MNIVSDMLSHFLNKIVNSKNWLLRNILENIDKKIHIYHITMIEMLSDFQNKIKKIYLKDKKWKKIIQQLHYFEKNLADIFLYFYFMNENLIYYLNFVDTWQWFWHDFFKKTNYSFVKFIIFKNFKKSWNLFKSDWLISTIYFLLCSTDWIATEQKDSSTM